MKVLDNNLGANLAELRHIAGLSQTQIADMIGVKQSTISSFEKRNGDIKLMTLMRYVHALGGKMKIHIELADGSSRVI